MLQTVDWGFYHQQKLGCQQLQGIPFYYAFSGHVAFSPVTWFKSKEHRLQFWSQPELTQPDPVYLAVVIRRAT